MFLRFIRPCSPVLANTVPAGDDWQHEIKFDGFRVQILKLGNEVELFSRNGSRFSRRFARLVSVLRELPAKSVILDGEIVASDAEGMPDFWRLFLRSAKPVELHVWAFDLLALNRKDLRTWSLEARRTYRILRRRRLICADMAANPAVSRRRMCLSNRRYVRHLMRFGLDGKGSPDDPGLPSSLRILYARLRSLDAGCSYCDPYLSPRHQ